MNIDNRLDNVEIQVSNMNDKLDSFSNMMSSFKSDMDEFRSILVKFVAGSRPASPSIPAVSTIQQPTIILAASMDLVETTVTDPVIVIPITTAPPVMQQSAAVEQPVTKRTCESN